MSGTVCEESFRQTCMLLIRSFHAHDLIAEICICADDRSILVFDEASSDSESVTSSQIPASF